MKLNFKEFGSGQPLIILHGLFGSLDNWVTLAKTFGEKYRVLVLDQRNHGQSPHSDAFTYEYMAQDLKEFIDVHGIESPVLLGHSMGGKTAMEAALSFPNLIKKLIVVDIGPKSYEVHHRTILDGLLSLNFQQIKSRSEADEKLAHFIPEKGIRQFLLKNLYWVEKDQLALRFNLSVLNREVEPISQWQEHTALYQGPTLFIRGGKSAYLHPNETSIFNNFPNVRLHSIEQAGHWVHAEAPNDLYREVVAFIDK